MTKVLQISHPSWDDNEGAVAATQYASTPRGNQCPFFIRENESPPGGGDGSLKFATNPCYLAGLTLAEAKREAWNRNGKCRVCNGAADGMHDPLKNRTITEPELP